MKPKLQELELELIQENVKPGRTFSKEGLASIGPTVNQWAGEQIVNYWDATGIPPTRLVIRATIEVQ